MMTLDALETLNPQPAITAPELPMTVLFEATRSMPEQEIVPDTLITAVEPDDRALDRAEDELTVVGDVLPPPVVPPPCVAHPTGALSAADAGCAVMAGPATPVIAAVRPLTSLEVRRISVLLPCLRVVS
ncbi:hypothetical protein GCM10020216_094270 [Nonomuraea helvata]